MQILDLGSINKKINVNQALKTNRRQSKVKVEVFIFNVVYCRLYLAAYRYFGHGQVVSDN